MQLYIGSYTQQGPDGVGGAGITHAGFDPNTGQITGVAEYKQASNPSWVHVDDGGQWLFTASEGDPKAAHSFSIHKDGSLEHLSQQDALGFEYCHLATTPERLFAASYGSGRLTGFPLDKGVLEPSDQCVAYEGSGPNKQRQASSHAHQALVSPDGRWLYVCDLGMDRIHVHVATGPSDKPTMSIEVPAGAGPRHLVFHDELPVVYVWCELKPLLVEMVWDSSTGALVLRRVHDLSDHAEGLPMGDGAAVQLHPSGRWLGVSERTSHTVCLFVLGDDGSATWGSRVPAYGEHPRDFAFSPDGKWLLVAYRDTHAVVVLAMDVVGRVSLEPVAPLKPVGRCVCGWLTIERRQIRIYLINQTH